MNVTDICNVMGQSSDAYAQFVQLSALYRDANGQSCEGEYRSTDTLWVGDDGCRCLVGGLDEVVAAH